MADVKQISGGAAVPSATLVQCDQITVLGDGSHGDPLRATGGGTISVVTDGTTILGDGTTDDPLRAADGEIAVVADGTTILNNGTTDDPLRATDGEIAVVADGTTITGDGTTDDPLTAVGGGAISVVADGTTITGDGTTDDPLTAVGGGAISVVADGTTILGNGTTDDPLRASSSGGTFTFTAAFRGGSLQPAPGQPVLISVVSDPGGITTVKPSTATNDLSDSSVDGVVASVNEDNTVEVQSGGLLTLTTGQWDAVTGDVGGLVLGRIYYLKPFPAFAGLSSTPNAIPAVFLTKVGVALNATTMLLALPALPIKNLGDETFIASINGQPPLIGTVVFVFTNNQVKAATSNVSLTEAQAVGIVVAFDIVNGVNPVVQMSGVVTLTTDQWDAITDTIPGMQASTAYYVGTSSTAGSLTAIKPEEGAVTQVGVGLSTTKMILNPPFPLRLT